VFNPLRRVLLGSLLPSSQAPHERLSKVTGLSVLSSDALSSVAYATDAMLAVLVPAGLLAVGATRPLTFLIAALLVIVTFSYRQTIHAYPHGQDVRAVHVDLDAVCAAEITREWVRWGSGATLEVLESPYRSFVEPVLQYVQKVEPSGPTG